MDPSPVTNTSINMDLDKCIQPESILYCVHWADIVELLNGALISDIIHELNDCPNVITIKYRHKNKINIKLQNISSTYRRTLQQSGQREHYHTSFEIHR